MQAVATVAAHRAIQFPGLFALSSDTVQPIKPIQRNVQCDYANEMRDRIIRCTRQPSGIQTHHRRVKFLAGVEVREISMDEWVKANAEFKPVWRG